MKYILIISDHNLENPSGAAYSRMMNYAKAITRAEKVKVILCSFQHMDNTNTLYSISDKILYVGSYKSKLKTLRKYFYPFFSTIFLIRINRVLRKLDGVKIVLVFSMKIFNDLLILLNFKLLNKLSVYVEKNELLHTIEISDPYLPFGKKLIIKAYSYFDHRVRYINDAMVLFYKGVIVISTSIDKWVNKYNSNTLRIPILTDTTVFPKIDRNLSNNTNEFRVAYSGAISNRKDGVLILINSIIKAKRFNHNIKLDLFGNGSKYEIKYLMNYLHQHEIDYIIYKGNIDHSMLVQILPTYDLLVLPRPYSLQANYGFSTKLADYLASGVPTLTTDISDNSLYLENNFNAYVIKVDELDNLDEVLIKVYNSEKRIDIGSNGKQTAKMFFDYRNYSNLLTEFLQ